VVPTTFLEADLEFQQPEVLLMVVEDQPLACRDTFSVKLDGLVETDRIVVDKLGAVYPINYHQDQK